MLDIEFVTLGLARGEDEMDDVIPNFVIDVDLIDQLAGALDFLEFNDARDVVLRRSERHLVENLALLLKGRVANDDLEHEAIHLRLRQRISSLLVNWIFR